MPDNSNTPLSLPPKVNEAEAETTMRKYAPLVRLHADEEHLPANPEHFRDISRYRMSWPGRDNGWTKKHGKWEKGDKHGDEYHSIPWDQIVSQSDYFRAKHGDPNHPPKRNLRPRDGNNLFSEGSQRGLFLQRAQRLHNDFSGILTTPQNEIVAPVFVDTTYNPELHTVRVLFWFFYELNHWKFMITHEGDWEHVTLAFREDDFRSGGKPLCIYFAQHNTGHPIALDKIETIEDTHPIIYVHKHGHPCHATVEHPKAYHRTWKTWDVPWVFIPKAEWRDFAGAWGEVGETKHTTGPLGPAFKRNSDNIPIRMINGKAHVVLKS